MAIDTRSNVQLKRLQDDTGSAFSSAGDDINDTIKGLRESASFRRARRKLASRAFQAGVPQKGSISDLFAPGSTQALTDLGLLTGAGKAGRELGRAGRKIFGGSTTSERFAKRKRRSAKGRALEEQTRESLLELIVKSESGEGDFGNKISERTADELISQVSGADLFSVTGSKDTRRREQTNRSDFLGIIRGKPGELASFDLERNASLSRRRARGDSSISEEALSTLQSALKGEGKFKLRQISQERINLQRGRRGRSAVLTGGISKSTLGGTSFGS